MTRLLLFCLVIAVLLALTYGENNNNDKSLEKNKLDENGTRKVRDIHDSRKENKRSRKNKATRHGRKRHSKKKGSKQNKKKRMNHKRKTNKNRKQIKHRNKKSKGKKNSHKKNKKSGKKNTHKKKASTHGKNDHGKLQKHKKIKVNKKLNKKRRMKGRPIKKKQERKGLGKATCVEESCINNAVSYIKLAKDKVKNFLSQVSRVEKSQKAAKSKSGKKGLFSPIINRIREAGGGNLSSLKCNGDSSGNGAQAMKNLTDALGKCESNINESCVANIPTINATVAATCKTYMTAFDTLLKKCIAKTGTDACSCWTDESFTGLVTSIKTCDFSKENKKMTSAKKSCIAAFGKCRKIEDSVSETLSACSPGNTASQAKNAVKNGVSNKIAASSFLKKINETINKNSRLKSNLSCSAFVKKVKKINTHLFNAPLNKAVASIINETVNITIGSCTTDEKTSLKTEETKLIDIIEIIEEAVEDVQKDLKIQTGTTTSIAAIKLNVRSIGSFLSSNWLTI